MRSKTLLLFCLSLIWLLPKMMAEAADSTLTVSLLTCTPGEEVYSTFGHTAIRVIDPVNGKDLVYDFGVFSFKEPNFIGKFLRGSLKYHLSEKTYKRFKRSYVREKRGVIEQELLLSLSEKQNIYKALQENYLPENRYYLYDFLFDNCSTRVRDFLLNNNQVTKPTEPHKTEMTFRDYLNVYLVDKKWLSFGIDLLLGARVDQKVETTQDMFLPNTLSQQLSEVNFVENGNTKPLLGPIQVILPTPPPAQKTTFLIQPVFVFTLLGLLSILLSGYSPKSGKVLLNIYFILLGIIGIVLVALWFGTMHYATKENWNLLWANPLYLFLPFLKNLNIKKYLLFILMGLASLTIVLPFVIPQEINIATMPLILMVAVLSGLHLYRNKE